MGGVETRYRYDYHASSLHLDPPCRGNNPSEHAGTPEVSEADHLCKLVIIGDRGTGKTCIASRIRGGKFSASYLYTIAVEFSTHHLCLNDDLIKVQIWDMAGDSQTWPASERTCFQYAHGVAIVYDVTDKKTFKNVPKWVKKYRNTASAEAKLMLIGNKCDRSEEKEVEYSTGRMFADEIGVPFMEVSAEDGSNVDLAFASLLADIMSTLQDS